MIQEYYRSIHLHDGDEPFEEGACPVCGRNDTTTRASAVSRAQRGRFVLEDGSRAVYESELGALLGRPVLPALLPIDSVVVAFIVGWLLLAIDLALVAGLRAQDLVSIPDSALSATTYLGIFWFGLLIPAVAVLRYFLRRQDVSREMPAWREACRRWQRFYYCSRDDIVFVPGEGHGVSPEHVSVLHRQPLAFGPHEPEEAAT